MVLKLIFILTLLLNSFTAFGKTPFDYALNQHLKAKYSKSNKVLNKRYQPFKMKADKRVYLLMGSNYELLKKYRMAKNTYITLLKNYYYKQYRKDFIKIKRFKLENYDEEVDDELAAIYYKLGNILSKLAKEKFEDGDKYKKDLKLSKIFLTLASKAEGDIADTADEGIDQVGKVEELIASHRSSYKIGFVMGRMLWSDKFTLKDLSSDTETELFSNTEVVSFAVDIRYQSDVDFIRFLAGGFTGNSVVGVKNTYFTNNATSTGAHGLLSYNWVYSLESSFGFSFPFLYRTINLQDSTIYKIEPKSLSSYGYGIDHMWHWKGLNLGIGINMMSGFNSATWRLELGYLF